MRLQSSISNISMKMLLIRNDNIGDLACTTPLLEVLRKAYPDAIIDFLGNSYNVDLVRHDTRLSHIWFYEKAKHVAGIRKKASAIVHKALTLFKLRCKRYDIVIIAVPTFNKRTLCLARWIHPKAIYGASTKEHALPSNYHAVVISPEESHVLQVFAYARALGIKEAAPEAMSLILSAEEQKTLFRARAMFAKGCQQPLIGLQISARRPKQRWSYQQWEELIQGLLPYAKLRLFWSPGSASTPQHPGDDQLASQLATAFPTVIATPTTDLRSLMVAFSTCDLILGSDGGAMHIAAGLDVETITLFGDIDATIWRPYSKKATVITSPTDTLADLNPAIVVKKVIEIIQNRFKL